MNFSDNKILNLSESTEEKGKQIYKENEHFKRLANFMEHPEFREFYDIYMKDWNSVKLIMLFMKTYEEIEKQFKNTISPYQKISILKDIFDNSEMRQKLCQSIISAEKENESVSTQYTIS